MYFFYSFNKTNCKLKSNMIQIGGFFFFYNISHHIDNIKANYSNNTHGMSYQILTAV